MKGLVSDRVRQDGGRQAVEHETPPWLSPAARNDQPQTNHRQNEGRKKYRPARAVHVMARMVVARQKQTRQILIFQVAPNKLSKLGWDFLPRCARPDIRNLPEPLCQLAGMRPVKQNERHQRDAVCQPYRDYAKQTT